MTRYIDAIHAALDEALAGDPAVVLLGEDIASGGPFGATSNLAATYGEERVRNTPISEGTILGLAVGAALMGRRPIVEIMFMDFITLAMDQLVNHAAKLRYMSGGQLHVPLTIRVQAGAVGGFGAHHSQSLEAWLTHVPGLKVVAPSTPADAKVLLTAAIRDEDPVVVVEHRGLYWDRGSAHEAGEVQRSGATVRRAGRDVTIVAWSRMVKVALEAAELLAAEGVEAEIVDVRWLLPLDIPSIVESVRRTRRLLIVSEAVLTGGLGGEIAATVGVSAAKWLLAPIERIGAPFAPVPAASQLEAVFVPTARDIDSAVRGMIHG